MILFTILRQILRKSVDPFSRYVYMSDYGARNFVSLVM